MAITTDVAPARWMPTSRTGPRSGTAVADGGLSDQHHQQHFSPAQHGRRDAGAVHGPQGRHSEGEQYLDGRPWSCATVCREKPKRGTPGAPACGPVEVTTVPARPPRTSVRACPGSPTGGPPHQAPGRRRPCSCAGPSPASGSGRASVRLAGRGAVRLTGPVIEHEGVDEQDHGHEEVGHDELGASLWSTVSPPARSRPVSPLSAPMTARPGRSGGAGA